MDLLLLMLIVLAGAGFAVWGVARLLTGFVVALADVIRGDCDCD